MYIDQKQRRNTYVKTFDDRPLLDIDVARKECNQDFSYDDDKITACVQAAQFQVEVILRRSLSVKTLVLQMDYFPPCDLIELSSGKVNSIVEVRYRDNNDESQVFDAANYSLDNNSIPDYLVREPNQSWPSTYSGRRNAVEVEYTVGFEDPNLIIAPIVKAMKFLTKHFYDNPDMIVVGTSQAVEVPKTVDYLLSAHRDFRW